MRAPGHEINGPRGFALPTELGASRLPASPCSRVKLRHARVSLDEACAFVSQHHRHHTPPAGHLFSIGAFEGARLCGVAIVGRPVARMRDNGLTAEITRLCTDGTRNAASFLLGRSARAAFALGFEKIGTYTLASEGGASLRAAGWRLIGTAGGGSWSRPTRERTDKAPTEQKALWELEPA